MPISLAIFRLELADETNRVDNFCYTAPDFTLSRGTYAQAASATPQLSKEQLANFKGRREYQTFTIETFLKQEMAENEENAGTEVAASEASDNPAMKSEVLESTEEEGACNLPPHETKSKSKIKRKSPSLDSQGSSRPGSGKNRSRDGPHSLRFFSGNPGVETTEGILHLYKDNRQTSLEEDVSRSEMICILKVPASIMSQDLIQFLAPVQHGLESIRIVRDSTPSQYMVLLKFRSQKFADEFYQNFNNKPFNSIEPDICYLVYVARLEAVASSEGAALPISGATELPVCPVCLERMDESVEGILTILCNHSFHCSCLAQWEDTTCPICRYVQTPENVADNYCFQCSSRESLWICLICGHVGCGRYNEGHAYRHFQETNHTYAMRLGSNSVWDYAGDNYVHRLVANKADGKMVELVDEAGNQVQEEKLDSLELEYTYLLTSQLKSQREFFAGEMKKLEKKTQKELEDFEQRIKKTAEENEKFRAQLDKVMAEKKSLEKRANQVEIRMAKILKDFEDELEMNRCLKENQIQYQERIKALEKKNVEMASFMAELEDRNRDLMFSLEAQQKLFSEVSQEELQDSKIVVSPSTSGQRKRHRKKPAK